MVNVSQIIAEAKFTQDEIDDATCGFCGTFALALLRVLRLNGVDARLLVFLNANFAIKEPYVRDGDVPWRHFAVLIGDTDIYDIRGLVSEEDINDYFDTDRHMVCSQEDAIRWMRDHDQTMGERLSYSNRLLRDWKRRLDMTPVVFELAA